MMQYLLKFVITNIYLLIRCCFFADTRFLFEGHLTVGQEPPPPAWLVAQNLTRELSILTESSGHQDGSNNRTVPRAEEITPAIMNLLETISGDRDLETALEESLQVCMNT
jgi:E3 ubiquitin-protein ligase AIP2